MPRKLTQKPEQKDLATSREVLSVYWEYTRRYPLYLVLIVLSAFGLQAAFLGAPLFLRQFFNLLAANTPNAAVVAELTGILVLVAGLYLIEWIARRIQGWTQVNIQARVMADLMSDAFGYLLGHSYNFFISRFSGSLTHKVNKFSKAYEALFDTILTSFLPTFIFVVGAVIVLATKHPILGLMLGLWVVCFIAFQVYVSLLRQPLRLVRSEAETQTTASLSDAISNQSTIALFSGRTYEQGVFHAVVEVWRAATKRSWLADEWIWAGVGFFMLAIEIALLYGAVIFWSRGLLTVGDFVLIQAYLLTTFDRLVMISRELRRFYDAFADASEMVAMLNSPHEVRDKRGAKRLRVDTGEVWFDDVTFNFHKGAPILHQFNLTIAGGERVALVGPSGAGKSTVTKLLLRLYDVDKGEIKIDKQDISKVTQDSLREAISFVPQEPILFHRTLMENIRYGYRDATDEMVIEAAKKAHCHEFISKLPLGYGTFVGERGIKLSGGERQRVAIARAILKDAPILVLDEATSSLDSESEALIQDALNVLMEGKTVIVIAHRLSTIMKMDRIIVMEAGAVVAQGTHLQLINERGLYQKLWSIQAGGFLGGSEDDETAVNVDEAGAEEDSAGLADRLAEEEK
ncbi:MAG: ABC transporter ATP-binding protein [Candidatus Pacebacteria bacterium]|nr:ABC transporter ATP-binding protein [Candidatus Paceibacterota bacterium]